MQGHESRFDPRAIACLKKQATCQTVEQLTSLIACSTLVLIEQDTWPQDKLLVLGLEAVLAWSKEEGVLFIFNFQHSLGVCADNHELRVSPDHTRGLRLLLGQTPKLLWSVNPATGTHYDQIALLGVQGATTLTFNGAVVDVLHRPGNQAQWRVLRQYFAQNANSPLREAMGIKITSRGEIVVKSPD